MADSKLNIYPQVQAVEPKSRALGSTEHNWCLAVRGGTGITVLAILVSKFQDISLVRNALHKLQISHPILRSRLHYDTSTNTFTFITSPTPFIDVKVNDLATTSQLLQTLSNENDHSTTPLGILLEHELNNNTWANPDRSSQIDQDLIFATLYTLPDEKWSMTLRLHASACDRTTAVSLLRDLLVLVAGCDKSEEGGIQKEKKNKEEVNLEIEELIPLEQIKKGFWARGMDMVGYSVNSHRQTNLKFKDVRLPRRSRVVRFQMNLIETERLLAGCKSRGIKLCGALSAAVLMAAHSSKRHHNLQRKYGVITLVDCRSLLNPPLSDHHFGHYQCPVLNIHAIKGGEKLWDLARKTYTAFSDSKISNKHFSDMADLNFLMCKAIENPSLTSSSSQRTSLVAVCEDPIFDTSNDACLSIGRVDYMGCASVHGIGSSIAIFDTIRDGRLDCVCVYPSPLHTKEQMEELVDDVKSILANAG